MSSHEVTGATVDVAARRALELVVLDRLRIHAFDRILFVQCGDGWIVEEAWRRALRAYACGLDRSLTHVELAKQWREVPGKLEFRTWDGQCLPVPDRGFDRVVATFALVQLQDPAGLLREVRRVLRAEGDVYLLHSVSSDAEFRRAVAQAGLANVRELARSDDQTTILVHARVALAASASLSPGPEADSPAP